MLNNLLQNVSTIYIAYGTTDFRKQMNSLCNMVKNEYAQNPYDGAAYIFCNRKRTSIKVLCYDRNRIYTSAKNIIRCKQ